MKCPLCGKRAIGFLDWAKSLRWTRAECDSCGRALKAGGVTWIGLAAWIALGSAFAADYARWVSFHGDGSGLAFGLSLVGAAALAGFYRSGGWKPAGYDIDDGSKK